MHIVLALLFNGVLVAVCAFAIIRGGRPERIGAAINLAASTVTTLLRLYDGAFFAPADAFTLLTDVAVTAGFFWLAVTTIRFWPIWAAGFGLSNVLMSLGTALLPHVQLFAYQTWIGVYAYLALGALALATYRLPRDADPVLRNGSRRQWLEKHRPMT